MNERIRELAEQATTYIEPTANSGEGWIFDKEKFAELIVRECIDICRYHPSIIVSNNWSGHDVAQDIVQRFVRTFRS